MRRSAACGRLGALAAERHPRRATVRRPGAHLRHALQQPGAQDGRFYDIWTPALGFGAEAHVSSTVPGPGQQLLQHRHVAGRRPAADLRRQWRRWPKSSGLFSTTNSTTAADGARLAQERWYATMITLADGRGLIMGGSVPYPGPLTAPTPEVYENGQWRSLFGASSVPLFCVACLGASPLPKPGTTRAPGWRPTARCSASPPA
jgi:hypothetical protein